MFARHGQSGRLDVSTCCFRLKSLSRTRFSKALEQFWFFEHCLLARHGRIASIDDSCFSNVAAK